MAQYEHLPIDKKAFDLLVYFARIVKNFSPRLPQATSGPSNSPNAAFRSQRRARTLR